MVMIRIVRRLPATTVSVVNSYRGNDHSRIVIWSALLRSHRHVFIQIWLSVLTTYYGYTL